MDDIIQRLNSERLWQFPGGIHPAEMKSQSNQQKIGRLAFGKQLSERLYSAQTACRRTCRVNRKDRRLGAERATAYP